MIKEEKLAEVKKLATANLVSYRQEPKWAGKMFMHDENTIYIDGFLAGLKEARTQWHDLRKDPNDLPEAENHFWSRDVLFQTNKGSSIIGFYDHANKAWYEKTTDDILLGVIAWCEIPEYTEV